MLEFDFFCAGCDGNQDQDSAASRPDWARGSRNRALRRRHSLRAEGGPVREGHRAVRAEHRTAAAAGRRSRTASATASAASRRATTAAAAAGAAATRDATPTEHPVNQRHKSQAIQTNTSNQQAAMPCATEQQRLSGLCEFKFRVCCASLLLTNEIRAVEWRLMLFTGREMAAEREQMRDSIG